MCHKYAHETSYYAFWHAVIYFNHPCMCTSITSAYIIFLEAQVTSYIEAVPMNEMGHFSYGAYITVYCYCTAAVCGGGLRPFIGIRHDYHQSQYLLCVCHVILVSVCFYSGLGNGTMEQSDLINKLYEEALRA